MERFEMNAIVAGVRIPIYCGSRERKRAILRQQILGALRYAEIAKFLFIEQKLHGILQAMDAL